MQGFSKKKSKSSNSIARGAVSEVAQSPGMMSLNSVGGHYLPGQQDKLGAIAMAVSGSLAIDPGTGTVPTRVYMKEAWRTLLTGPN